MRNSFTLLIVLVTFVSNAQIVNIPNANLKAYLLAYVHDGNPLNTNGDGEIQVTEAEAMTTLFLDVDADDLTGLEAFVNIEHLYPNGVTVSQFNLSWFPHLKVTNFGANQFVTTLDVTGCTELVHLEIELTNISNIIGLSTLTSLAYFDMSGLPMTSIDLTGLGNLRKFINLNGFLTSITFPVPNQLIQVHLQGNPFTTLDLTALHWVEPLVPPIDPIYPEYNAIELANCLNLQYVNIKNGSYRPLTQIDNCPNLQYVCADDDEIEGHAEEWAGFGIETNAYCSFTPGGNFNTISGNITFDSNSNGCDANDVTWPGLMMNINDGTNSSYTFSQAGGEYSLYAPAGSFTVTPFIDNNYYTVTPVSAVISFPDENNHSQTQDFCITSEGVHPDLEVTFLQIQPARPGFNSSYLINYRNKGNQVQSGSLDLAFQDAVLDYITSSEIPASQTESSLSWDFADLQPFEARNLTVTFNVNSPMETPAVNIGDELDFSATVNPTTGDETPEDNAVTFNQVVVGSYDPNDKTCMEGATIAPEMIGEYLHYLIRFQNSGTFYAENVVVKDTIDTEKFDISTLRLLSASHPYVTRITGNKVEFIFEGINLPAEQDDEPGSHGFVAFKIKTKPTLALNDTVENTAEIFFDFNFPIITNMASTTVTELGIGEFENTPVMIAPNPVKSMLQVSASDNITSIQVFDMQGRLLQVKLSNGTQSSIDFSGKTPGMYLVKVTTSAGIKVQKIVKE